MHYISFNVLANSVDIKKGITLRNIRPYDCAASVAAAVRREAAKIRRETREWLKV